MPDSVLVQDKGEYKPLPPLYFLFLAGMMAIYLLLVQLVKRRLMRRYA